MSIPVDEIIKLLVAVLVGGLIGLEREFHNKAAGFRTLIFICVGSTLFTMFSYRIGAGGNEARIAAQVVSGVGFLGAGVILQSSGRILGLTTAATIWLVAALGMGIGAGYFPIVISATMILLVVLWFFPKLETWVERLRIEHTYEIIISDQIEALNRVEAIFTACGVKVIAKKMAKDGAHVILTWYTIASTERQDQLKLQLLQENIIIGFRY